MSQARERDWQRASHYLLAGQPAPARAILESLVARDRTDVAAWIALFHLDLRAGRVKHAAEHADRAAAAGTTDPGLMCEVVSALATVGETAAAMECLVRAARYHTGSAALMFRIALHFQMLGDHDAALQWMDRARSAGADDPQFHFCHAIQLTFHGRLDEAEAELETCASADPPFGRAMAQLTQLRKQTSDRNHLARLGLQVRRVVPGSEDHAALEFARYKELEDLGRHAEAWSALDQANRFMHALLRHDPEREGQVFEALIDRSGSLRGRSGAQSDGGPQPIFIIGLPRSGTTLLDRMLGNHSEIRSAGELGTFYRCLQRVADRATGPMLDAGFVECIPDLDHGELGRRYLANTQSFAKGRRFYVDKMPRNWLLAGLIQGALPGARILHMVRDPTDVCFSNYRAYFGSDYPYSYDQAALAAHYRGYRRVMEHWHSIAPGRILDVAYDGLVAQPQFMLRKIFDFCGVTWEPGCEDLSRNRAPVATPSATQVIDRVRTSESRAWAPYAAQLSVLRRGLATAPLAPG